MGKYHGWFRSEFSYVRRFVCLWVQDDRTIDLLGRSTTTVFRDSIACGSDISVLTLTSEPHAMIAFPRITMQLQVYE